MSPPSTRDGAPDPATRARLARLQQRTIRFGRSCVAAPSCTRASPPYGVFGNPHAGTQRTARHLLRRHHTTPHPWPSPLRRLTHKSPPPVLLRPASTRRPGRHTLQNLEAGASLPPARNIPSISLGLRAARTAPCQGKPVPITYIPRCSHCITVLHYECFVRATPRVPASGSRPSPLPRARASRSDDDARAPAHNPALPAILPSSHSARFATATHLHPHLQLNLHPTSPSCRGTSRYRNTRPHHLLLDAGSRACGLHCTGDHESLAPQSLLLPANYDYLDPGGTVLFCLDPPNWTLRAVQCCT